MTEIGVGRRGLPGKFSSRRQRGDRGRKKLSVHTSLTHRDETQCLNVNSNPDAAFRNCLPVLVDPVRVVCVTTHLSTADEHDGDCQ